jgi:hypothetical protein
MIFRKQNTLGKQNHYINWNKCGAILSIVAITGLFTYTYFPIVFYVCLPLLEHKPAQGITFLVLYHVLLVTTFINYLRTAFSDPGYIEDEWSEVLVVVHTCKDTCLRSTFRLTTHFHRRTRPRIPSHPTILFDANVLQHAT